MVIGRSLSLSKAILASTSSANDFKCTSYLELIPKGITVVLTARDEDKGKAAGKKLQKTGLNVIFQPLDVTDSKSVSELKSFIQQEFGKLDVLINNAGIAIDGHNPGINPDIDAVRQTLNTNVVGPLLLCKAFIPLMKQNNSGKIINVSSGMGAVSSIGGGNPGYRISKAALNAMTLILADELGGTNITVNAMCPGWVRTGMGGSTAARSVEEGADTAVWLGLLPDGGYSGKFFRDRQEIPW